MNYYELLIRRSRNQSPQDNEIWYYAPEQVTLYSETDVTSHTFSGGKGVITFSSSVTTVPAVMQGVTTVTDVQFPSTVTSIAANAFNGCTSLALKKLPDGLTGIGNSAFHSCTNLALTELPASLTEIGDLAFYSCSSLALTSLPAGVTSIGNKAFAWCSSLALTSLPAGLTSISDSTFFGCSNLALTSLPEGLTSIADGAFRDCSNLALTSLPAGVTSIPNGAFRDCSNLALTSLPAGVTSIGPMAFFNCPRLALTSLPAGVTSIGILAFSGCTGLTSITFLGTPTTLADNAFNGCTNLKDIYVPWAEGDIAGAPWGAGNATVHYTGSGSGGAISFPESFTVTACSGNGAAVGQYTKTSEKTTVNGVDYPVYSRYHEMLGTTFYIFVCDKFNGASGAYWALNGDSEYSSTMDGNTTLGAVSVGSDGLPTSTTWTSANGTATIAEDYTSGDESSSSSSSSEAGGGVTYTMSRTSGSDSHVANALGTYSLESGTDGNTDAVYVNQNGWRIYYNTSTSRWALGESVGDEQFIRSTLEGTYTSWDYECNDVLVLQKDGKEEQLITFPESFSVTACPASLGATYASFTRTSNTTTVNGTNYPVYSMTNPSPMWGTYNIYVCQYKQGSTGVFWALNNRDTYSATDDGYNSLGALGCVAAGSDGLPTSTTWTSTNGTATVSWS